ncbi:spore coat protein CotJB [Clostridium tyrobutyricum]|uniref:spore coat protein CotJB n=1 Tax=Clostridium tyrobutyricum TaxID=1519 RepID=UPI001C38F48A|nr:spore coat protein CotJB [Clostridium tyrobutyricum]MBV4420543.1 spore coat protein CotJB [Clostridium tyrobutyricum]
MSDRKNLLNKIRQLEFAALDLNLYLDNFPNNREALSAYNKYTEKLICMKEEYEDNYGLLTNFGSGTSQYPWSWVNEPWPWEPEAYRE